MGDSDEFGDEFSSEIVLKHVAITIVQKLEGRIWQKHIHDSNHQIIRFAFSKATFTLS